MTQTKDFNNWTEYDDWIIQNYGDYGITSLNEIEGGKVRAEFVTKEEWAEEAARIEAAKSAENAAPQTPQSPAAK